MSRYYPIGGGGVVDVVVLGMRSVAPSAVDMRYDVRSGHGGRNVRQPG